MDPFILFDDRVSPLTLDNRLFFSNGVEEIVCWQSADLNRSLERIDELKQSGHYLAGFISYEAGYFLNGLSHEDVDSSIPLMHFTAYKQCTRLNAEGVEIQLAKLMCEATCKVDNIRLNINKSDYVQAFKQIKELIHNGYTYQVNLTSKYSFEIQGSPVHLYQQLRDRQKVSYSALLYFNDYQILSLSPELFFCKAGDRVTVEPMKGTMPRADDSQQDLDNKQFLTTDPKSIAENTMIVDLLRNDLSSISHPGSVQVSELLKVTSYETLHQMTSKIQSLVDPELSFKTIISRLFPCGSITGAPKNSTMKIIAELEQSPRHVYTGAIGYITPKNDMCFNVPIRTLLIKNHRGELGVGGGIVYDSDVDEEFAEMKLKANFFTKMAGVDHQHA